MPQKADGFYTFTAGALNLHNLIQLIISSIILTLWKNKNIVIAKYPKSINTRIALENFDDEYFNILSFCSSENLFPIIHSAISNLKIAAVKIVCQSVTNNIKKPNPANIINTMGINITNNKKMKILFIKYDPFEL